MIISTTNLTQKDEQLWAFIDNRAYRVVDVRDEFSVELEPVSTLWEADGNRFEYLSDVTILPQVSFPEQFKLVDTSELDMMGLMQGEFHHDTQLMRLFGCYLNAGQSLHDLENFLRLSRRSEIGRRIYTPIDRNSRHLADAVEARIEWLKSEDAKC